METPMIPIAARQLLLNKKHMTSAAVILALLWMFRGEVLTALGDLKDAVNQHVVDMREGQQTTKTLLKLICTHGAQSERERTECYLVE